MALPSAVYHGFAPRDLEATFARRLRKARHNANLSQTSLSQRVGTGQDSISHYEQGQSLPSVPTLVRLAR